MSGLRGQFEEIQSLLEDRQGDAIGLDTQSDEATKGEEYRTATKVKVTSPGA